MNVIFNLGLLVGVLKAELSVSYTGEVLNSNTNYIYKPATIH